WTPARCSPPAATDRSLHGPGPCDACCSDGVHLHGVAPMHDDVPRQHRRAAALHHADDAPKAWLRMNDSPDLASSEKSLEINDLATFKHMPVALKLHSSANDMASSVLDGIRCQAAARSLRAASQVMRVVRVGALVLLAASAAACGHRQPSPEAQFHPAVEALL